MKIYIDLMDTIGFEKRNIILKLIGEYTDYKIRESSDNRTFYNMDIFQNDHDVFEDFLKFLLKESSEELRIFDSLIGLGYHFKFIGSYKHSNSAFLAAERLAKKMRLHVYQGWISALISGGNYEDALELFTNLLQEIIKCDYDDVILENLLGLVLDKYFLEKSLEIIGNELKNNPKNIVAMKIKIKLENKRQNCVNSDRL